MLSNNSLESFDNPGWRWRLTESTRTRFKPNRLLVHPGAGKRHIEMRVSIQFIGESVEYAANPIAAEDSGNHPNRDEPEIVESADEGEKEFELDSSKCPSCRSDMDYEVAMECKGKCVVCLEENVICLVSCTTYRDKHGMCKQFCYPKYARKNDKVK